ncbi:13079_t:CDS:2 [Entrophospora sp. SA101]|nr:13079_t:CDS:2 [Entrophospora sp. SA101]
MVVDEVTEILSFDQTNWLAPYIEFNTKLRQKAENDFEKDFFKLMNNSVYGKTMENVRKQLSNTLIGAHMGQASVVLNKPIIVGASVLGLSKLLMYRFWYGYVKEKYGDKAKLGYMDTDGMIFQTETEDIYKDMAERPDIFDLTDSKTIGLFKDECPGKIITESIHIRAKTYHYVISDKSTKSKHKGVSKGGMNDLAINVNTNTYDQKLEP